MRGKPGKNNAFGKRSKMMLVDSHCHLDDERLYGQADEIVASLASDGIGRVIDAGSDLVSSERAVFLAERFFEEAGKWNFE